MEHFDLGVNLAFWLSILSALLCIIYGGINWNNQDRENARERRKWAKDEDKMERRL
ncbi:MAG: symporter small accessory protein [Campylobacterota bacterium]